MDQFAILKSMQDLDARLRAFKENKLDVDEFKMRGLIKDFEHVTDIL